MCSVAQWCLTFCDSMDCGLPDSSVYGIFQARGVSFPTEGDLLVLGIKAESLGSPALPGGFLTTMPLGKDT